MHKNCPKVLVVAIGKINFADDCNNGLLLRNLFGKDWPKENVAQIYSSGDNGDCGYFGQYYRIVSVDRRFGKIFYRFKSNVESDRKQFESVVNSSNSVLSVFKSWIKRAVLSILVDSGLYEVIFKPRLSSNLLDFVSQFQPDIIFAQGYNLTFSSLPLLLKDRTGAKLAVFTTDDWPTYLYAGLQGETTALRWIIRPIVKKIAYEFFSNADISFAFGEPMAIEYSKRYANRFISLYHSDDPARFRSSLVRNLSDGKIRTFIAIGNFNKYRFPLLLDANQACEQISSEGTGVRILVLSSSFSVDDLMKLDNEKFIDVLPDPGNDALPSFLKGADGLLLIEGFDDGFVSAIALSISSKSHLFMFSEKPIIVYGGAETGVVKYAREFGWATVVDNRSVPKLASEMSKILFDKVAGDMLVDLAYSVAIKNHSLIENSGKFYREMTRDWRF